MQRMKKPPFNQLRGTVAQKYRHRIALGFTMGSFGLALIFNYIFIQFSPLPKAQLIEPHNYKDAIYYKIPKRSIYPPYEPEKEK